jgi:hypothetical protein
MKKIVAVILVVVIGIALYVLISTDDELESTNPEIAQEQTTPGESPTGKYRGYTNNRYEFRFEFPSELVLKESIPEKPSWLNQEPGQRLIITIRKSPEQTEQPGENFLLALQITRPGFFGSSGEPGVDVVIGGVDAVEKKTHHPSFSDQIEEEGYEARWVINDDEYIVSIDSSIPISEEALNAYEIMKKSFSFFSQ